MITRAPRISARKRNALIKCFAIDVTATQAVAIAKVSRDCANRYYRHFRELIYMSMRKAPRFAGEIEIDQTFFGGRRQKKDAALVRRLAGLTRKQILRKKKRLKPEKRTEVLGFLQRGGAIYTHVVARSDSDTLIPLIRLVVEQGSKIYTDKWPAFNPLTSDGYKHYAINHSVEYRDRRGRHINGIERFWGFSKDRLRKFAGISRSTMPLHIKECEWRYNTEDLIASLKAMLKLSSEK